MSDVSMSQFLGHDPLCTAQTNEILKRVSGLASSLHGEFCAFECIDMECTDLEVSEVAAMLDTLIAKVREDMLAKFITGIENWPVSSWQQHTQPDGAKEPKRFLIDKADVLDALRALQEKP